MSFNNPILFIIPGACAFGSHFSLERLRIPYKICLTTSEIRKSPAFLKINPLGKVGALLVGDEIVYENLAILLYLADKYPESELGLPLNSKIRQEAYQWLSYFSSTLHPTFGQAKFPARFISNDNIEAFKDNAINRLSEILKYINSFLASHNLSFLSKSNSIIDGQAYGLLRWGKDLFNYKEIFPSIYDFLSKMESDQVVQNTSNIEFSNPSLIRNSSFAGYFEL